MFLLDLHTSGFICSPHESSTHSKYRTTHLLLKGTRLSWNLWKHNVHRISGYFAQSTTNVEARQSLPSALDDADAPVTRMSITTKEWFNTMTSEHHSELAGIYSRDLGRETCCPAFLALLMISWLLGDHCNEERFHPLVTFYFKNFS